MLRLITHEKMLHPKEDYSLQFLQTCLITTQMFNEIRKYVSNSLSMHAAVLSCVYFCENCKRKSCLKLFAILTMFAYINLYFQVKSSTKLVKIELPEQNLEEYLELFWPLSTG